MAKKTESNGRKKKVGKEPLPKDTGPGTARQKLSSEFLRHLFYTLGKFRVTETPNDLFMAHARSIRDRLLERLRDTVQNN